MNRYVIVLLFSFFAFSCNSSLTEHRKTYVDSNVVVNDTFYIRQSVINDTTEEAIFIDPNKNSGFYDELFAFNETDTNNIKIYLNRLHDENVKLKHFDLRGLDSLWAPVYKYGSKYYLYRPSDSGNKGVRYITSSMFMFYYMDGLTPVTLGGITKTSESTFNIKFRRMIEEDQSAPEELNIYITDPKSKLAIWEFKNGAYSEYELMVPQQSLAQFQVVIMKSDYGKRPEFDFEPIDFKKLIAGVKR